MESKRLISRFGLTDGRKGGRVIFVVFKNIEIHSSLKEFVSWPCTIWKALRAAKCFKCRNSMKANKISVFT